MHKINTPNRLRGALGRLPLHLKALVFAAVASSLWGAAWRNRPSGRPSMLQSLPDTRRPITVAIVSPAQHNDRINEAVKASLTEDLRCRRAGLRQIGLVKTTEPTLYFANNSILGQAMGEAFTPAAYIMGSDTIFALRADDRSISHEWVHAIDDQYSGRMARAQMATTTDEELARHAAIEGSAIVLSGGRVATTASPSTMDDASWGMSYAVGPRFVTWAAKSPIEMLQLEPRTSYEVIFHNPPASDPGLPVPAMESDESIACTDRIGVLGVALASNKAGVGETKTLRAMQGWISDRLDVIRGLQGTRVVWQVAFADTNTATQWMAVAMRTALTSPQNQVLSVAYPVVRPKTALDSLSQ